MEKAKHELEMFKKYYHKNHPESSKQDESLAVVEKAEEFIKNILPTAVSGKNCQASETKAFLLSEAAKLYNVLDEYNALAEKFLSKSVRINPKRADSWHELGLCVMKRNDLEYAQSCFKIALQLEKTAPILTSLAVAMRLVALNQPEPAQTEIRSKAMNLISEACRLNPSHGPSNIAYATGLFYRFFSSSKGDLQLLEKVVETYEKALECESSRTDSQVHINMATCLQFMEKYEEALVSLQKAVEFDSRNELETAEKLDSFVNYLLKFSDAIQKKGRMKTKRLTEMVNELKKQQGTGQETCFRAKIIGNVGHDQTIPVALVGVDASGEVYGITVYNCLSNFGFIIGDTVTVAKPDFRNIQNLTIPSDPPTTIGSIKWVRVASPMQMKKNGVPLPESVLARAVASTQTK